MGDKTVNVEIEGISCDIAFRYRRTSHDLVIFLHGLGCSKDSFEAAWVHSDLKDFSLLSFDLVGFGHSAKPREFSYSMEAHARICEALIGNFSEHRLHIVAHSMGGAIGLLLSGNILESTVSFANVEGNLVREDCDLVSRESASVSCEEFEDNFFERLKSRFMDEQRKTFALNLTTPYAFYKSSESLVAWSDSGKLLQKFRNLNCKKAYFYGKQNSGMKILTELGEIETIGINKSGHFVMNDNPGEFYSKLCGFLTG